MWELTLVLYSLSQSSPGWEWGWGLHCWRLVKHSMLRLADMSLQHLGVDRFFNSICRWMNRNMASEPSASVLKHLSCLYYPWQSPWQITEKVRLKPAILASRTPTGSFQLPWSILEGTDPSRKQIPRKAVQTAMTAHLMRKTVLPVCAFERHEIARDFGKALNNN